MLLLGTLAVALPAAAEQTLDFLGMSGPLPDDWQRQQPSSSMRLAQFSLPGEPPAAFIVYYFGRGQGGSVERNVARWRSQFSRSDGQPVPARVERLSGTAVPVTRVRLDGDYRRGIGAASDASLLADHTLLAAIIDTGSGPVILQLYGPRSSVERHLPALDRFLLQIRRDTR